MNSLRRTLTSWLLGGVLAVTLLAGIAIFSVMRRTLVANFDGEQLAKARAIASVLELDDDGLEFKLTPGAMPEFSRAEDPEYFQIWLADGTVVERAISLHEGELPRRVGNPGSPVVFDLALPDGREGRATGYVATIEKSPDDEDGIPVAQEAKTPASLEVAVVVARSRAPLEASLAAVRNSCLFAFSALAFAILVLVPSLVRRCLRPLFRLGEQVAEIDAATLSRRVELETLPVELEGPARKLNDLLGRLESAFSRERRMTANIAHELRTPIAELKTAIDIAQRWPDDAELARSAIDAGAAIAERMGGLVAGLLRLARIESGTASPALEDVDLRELAAEVFASHAAAAESRGLEFENATPHDLVLRTDRTLLATALSNLFDNAIRFATERTAITCEAQVDEAGRVTWTLRNRTVSFDPKDLPRLTEAFWQGDAARADGRHAGLGLTLVQSIARVLGFDLEFACDVTFEARLTSRRAVSRGALSLR